MVADLSKIYGLPPQNDIQSVIDQYRKQNASGHRICFRLARARVFLDTYQLWHNMEIAGPTSEPGSTKAGVPLEHPVWTITRHSTFGITISADGLYLTTTWPNAGPAPAFPVVVMFAPPGSGVLRPISPFLEFSDFQLVTGASFNSCVTGRY